MSGADYYQCPICNKKALYGSDEYGVGRPDIEVVHVACLEADRAEREQAVRQKVAQEIRAAAQQCAAAGDTSDALLGMLCAVTVTTGQPYRSIEALADQLDALHAIARAGSQ